VRFCVWCFCSQLHTRFTCLLKFTTLHLLVNFQGIKFVVLLSDWFGRHKSVWGRPQPWCSQCLLLASWVHDNKTVSLFSGTHLECRHCIHRSVTYLGNKGTGFYFKVMWISSLISTQLINIACVAISHFALPDSCNQTY